MLTTKLKVLQQEVPSDKNDRYLAQAIGRTSVSICVVHSSIFEI
jgi:hypothetical protein